MFIVFISLILQLTLRPCARKVALKPFTWHCMAAGAPSKQLWVPCWKGVYTYIYIYKKSIRMSESLFIRNLFYVGKFSPPNYLGHDEEIRACVSASLKSVERVVDPPKSVPYLRSGPAVLFVIKLWALSHFYSQNFLLIVCMNLFVRHFVRKNGHADCSWMFITISKAQWSFGDGSHICYLDVPWS